MIRRLRSGSVVESSERRALVTDVSSAAPSPTAVGTLPASPTTGDVDEIDAAAFRKGYADGFEAGEQDAAQALAQCKADLVADAELSAQREQAHWQARHAQLDELLQGLSDAAQTHEQAMHELAFELAATTLQQVFTSDDGDRRLIARLCERLAQERRGRAVHIEVSALDRAMLPERVNGLVVVEAAELAAGQCRLVGPYGTTESSIEHRLSAIFDAMRQALGHRQR